jgi:folate-dependent tRNA-U54 methylase TrmFO/GidA
MNANFGLVEELPEPVRDKRLKRELLAARALSELGIWLDQMAVAHR